MEEEYKEDYVLHDYGVDFGDTKIPGKMYSEDYYEWIKDEDIQNLTNAQARFAEWCLLHKGVLAQVGDFNKIFSSIRSWLRKSKKKKK